MPDDEESELLLASTKKQIPRPPECWRTRNDKLKLRPVRCLHFSAAVRIKENWVYSDVAEGQ